MTVELEAMTAERDSLLLELRILKKGLTPEQVGAAWHSLLDMQERWRGQVTEFMKHVEEHRRGRLFRQRRELKRLNRKLDLISSALVLAGTIAKQRPSDTGPFSTGSE